jgi:alkylation response protein AidB-like acyl-CoA dehydrogenase
VIAEAMQIHGAHGVSQDSRLSDVYAQIRTLRQLCYLAATMADKKGFKDAKKYISMIKVAAPRCALEVIDEAMQIHGAPRRRQCPSGYSSEPTPHLSQRRFERWRLWRGSSRCDRKSFARTAIARRRGHSCTRTSNCSTTRALGGRCATMTGLLTTSQRWS